MHGFDLYLEGTGDRPVDGAALAAALKRCPWLIPTPDDPTRLVYRNPDTSVHFTLLLDPSVLPPPEQEGMDEAEGSARWRGVLPDEEDIDVEDDEDEDDEDDEDEDDEDEDEDFYLGEDSPEEEGEFDEPVDPAEHAPAHLPPVTFGVPLFRPSFFLRELAGIARELRAATGLSLIDPQARGGEGSELGDAIEEELVASWIAANRRAWAELDRPERVEVWPEKKTRDFHRWGLARAALADRLRERGIDVPVIQPARHDGRTATLVVWDSRKPTAIPRVDLVLLMRARTKRRLLGRKKVTEEVILPGDRLWEALARTGEFRDNPIPHLIAPDAVSLNAREREEIDAIATEPSASARRTELVGVVDFEREPTGADLAGQGAEGEAAAREAPS